MIKVTLKRILKERNITLTELSKTTGISLKALSAFQNQRTDGVQYNTLDKISKVLDLEIGEILIRVNSILKIDLNLDDEIEINNNTTKIDAVLSVTDINDQVYETPLSLSIRLFNFENHKQLFVNVEKFSRNGLPYELNEYISSEMSSERHSFFYLVSHLIIQELLLNKLFSSFNIYDDVRVSWRAQLPRFQVSNINSDAIANESERITFVASEYHINLVPLDPTISLEEANADLTIPYTANMDDLADSTILYKIEITENYERVIYITLD